MPAPRCARLLRTMLPVTVTELPGTELPTLMPAADASSQLQVLKFCPSSLPSMRLLLIVTAPESTTLIPDPRAPLNCVQRRSAAGDREAVDGGVAGIVERNGRPAALAVDHRRVRSRIARREAGRESTAQASASCPPRSPARDRSRPGPGSCPRSPRRRRPPRWSGRHPTARRTGPSPRRAHRRWLRRDRGRRSTGAAAGRGRRRPRARSGSRGRRRQSPRREPDGSPGVSTSSSGPKPLQGPQ